MLHTFDTKGWEANTAWCVPTAISFLTGVPLIHSHSRAAFMQDISLKEVKGVYSTEAVLLLREQGYKVQQIKLKDTYDDAPKLSVFLKNRTSYEKAMPLMITVEDNKDFSHMITAHFEYAADNWTMKPVPIRDFPHLNKYVTSAFIVMKG
jgi:hypothetical protein